MCEKNPCTDSINIHKIIKEIKQHHHFKVTIHKKVCKNKSTGFGFVNNKNTVDHVKEQEQRLSSTLFKMVSRLQGFGFFLLKLILFAWQQTQKTSGGNQSREDTRTKNIR
ncbi:hypothetical protein AMECASPLE_028355 [Ameca splendens]|uniref:Uncharacterized protein n=1 Tax=Ameca splendens TaxID=208324 RepID=A0ABV0XUN0_9TELE